ncbi:EexN family lipoprotein [Bartonella sp. A05]|uniref:EexN family lipoprotein n=1 Tax=Bartonella sp. A05 TaxID=2967261 RepID=UPI0022A9A957|nr:EexN family lipoprotein [Bartonella sp. A05]MCZ2204482.1 EexN family lipoprotein [Bartonella sp. A05]
MHKIIITTTLLCAGLVVFGCAKNTYSVANFKQNKELLNEWLKKCGPSEESAECQNARLADHELSRENIQKNMAILYERNRIYEEEVRKAREN